MARRLSSDGDLDAGMRGSGGLRGIARTMTAGGWTADCDSDVEALWCYGCYETCTKTAKWL
jgi:hypothetical protein